MKTPRYLSLLIFLMLALASCIKEPTKIEQPASTPSKFNEIKTDPSFNWNTILTIKLIITGLKTIDPIKNTLTITNKSKTANFYNGNHLMEENLSLEVAVPSTLDSLLIRFGSLEKMYKVEKTINADYIINYPEEN